MIMLKSVAPGDILLTQYAPVFGAKGNAWQKD